MKVFIARQARSDIFAIGQYIAGENIGAADRMMDALEARCAGLKIFPDRFPVAYPDPNPVRRLSEGAYNIFYTVRADHVRIERGLHSALDIGEDILSV